MTDKLKSIYQSGKVFTKDIPTTDADKQQIFLEETNQAAQTKVITEEGIYDAYKTGQKNKEAAIEDLMKKEGLDKNAAARKYNQIVTGTVKDKVPKKGRGIFGQALDSIVDSKIGKGVKTVAPFLPYVGTGYMVSDVLLSGPESFADVPEDEKFAIRKFVEDIGGDELVQKARVVEEAVSPVPATFFQRKDEEVVPFGEQLERLIPFGGIRGR